MQTSLKAIELIKHHEGVRFKPYKCPALLWTVCVGHVLYPEQAKLPMDERINFTLRQEDNRIWTKEEVDGILRADLQRFERGVRLFCPVNLTQGMYDGLISFAFNVGLGTLQRSTLRQKVLRGDKTGAGEEFLKYCMAGGKVLKGLQNRRIDERALFLGP
jgi:GH24 family phage-related lysozyme (muramidase)